MHQYLFLNLKCPSLGRARWESGLSLLSRSASHLLLFLFFLGILLGGTFGLFVPGVSRAAGLEAYLSAEALPQSFCAALWHGGKYFLLLLFLSTSYLGVVLLPAAVFLRGCLLSCSVSALFSAGSYRGLLYSFAVCGIPALFIMPCFLFAASNAFLSARRLLFLRFRQGEGAPQQGAGRHWVVVGAFLILDALYSVYLLPALLAGFPV
ncbi:MAG: hypothetical protein LIO60_05090 [Oscillospiraceae bacterium]|nr:hypothetical protein [Oscillospiraceae bacterium]